jgi:transposase
MLSLTSSHRYRLYLPVCDMRKGFDGLSGLVSTYMNEEVSSGTVFIFLNRRGDRIKLLVWEPGGMVIYYKRLEQGTFKRPKPIENSDKLSLNYAQLAMLIEGVFVEQTRQEKRFLLRSKC